MTAWTAAPSGWTGYRYPAWVADVGPWPGPTPAPAPTLPSDAMEVDWWVGPPAPSGSVLDFGSVGGEVVSYTIRDSSGGYSWNGGGETGPAGSHMIVAFYPLDPPYGWLDPLGAPPSVTPESLLPAGTGGGPDWVDCRSTPGWMGGFCADMGPYTGPWPLYPAGELTGMTFSTNDEIDFVVMLPNPAHPGDPGYAGDWSYDTPIWDASRYAYQAWNGTAYENVWVQDYWGDWNGPTIDSLPETPPPGVHLYVSTYFGRPNHPPPYPPSFYVPHAYAATGASAWMTQPGSWSLYYPRFDTVHNVVTTYSSEFWNWTLGRTIYYEDSWASWAGPPHTIAPVDTPLKANQQLDEILASTGPNEGFMRLYSWLQKWSTDDGQGTQVQTGTYVFLSMFDVSGLAATSNQPQPPGPIDPLADKIWGVDYGTAPYLDANGRGTWWQYLLDYFGQEFVPVSWQVSMVYDWVIDNPWPFSGPDNKPISIRVGWLPGLAAPRGAPGSPHWVYAPINPVQMYLEGTSTPAGSSAGVVDLKNLPKPPGSDWGYLTPDWSAVTVPAWTIYVFPTANEVSFIDVADMPEPPGGMNYFWELDGGMEVGSGVRPMVATMHWPESRYWIPGGIVPAVDLAWHTAGGHWSAHAEVRISTPGRGFVAVVDGPG